MTNSDLEKYLEDNISNILKRAKQDLLAELVECSCDEILENSEELYFFKQIENKRIKLTFVDIKEDKDE